ncbi:hypothetical protein C4E24_06830 [ANME-1 cluster archaeon AG-394-G21]|nr:hypothetical protein [ANME-1 cluster archaeon AG-394-G21]
MGKGGFKELRVWQKGKDLAVYTYRITNTGDFAKDYGLKTFTAIEKQCVEISRMLSKLISACLNSPCGI